MIHGPDTSTQNQSRAQRGDLMIPIAPRIDLEADLGKPPYEITCIVADEIQIMGPDGQTKKDHISYFTPYIPEK
jgi:hypothetical protein